MEREVIAQILDYGSWIDTVDNDDVFSIYETYRKKYFPSQAFQPLDKAFCNYFKVKEMPEELNEAQS
jgi:hypothetical protein